VFELTNRTAVVTGGSQGLGRGFATALARQGADIAIAYLGRHDEDDAAADKSRQDIEALGRRALLVEADLTSASQVAGMYEQVAADLGGVDILVNNVGGFPTAPRPLLELSEEDWDRSIELNLRSAFLCCRAVAPAMVRAKSGRIVNISASLSAATGMATHSHYSAAKAGLIAMSKALARELAVDGVTVNVVAPGHIDTPMNRQGIARHWWDDAEEVAGIAMGRTGTVAEVAAAVSFFASDEARWITGQTLHVNGGSYMS
jgi:3-oxoacyl-[acyl-carrier protein] reductase